MTLFVNTVPSEMIKIQNVNEQSQRRGALYVWTGRFVECLYATVRGNTSVVLSVASGPCRTYRSIPDLCLALKSNLHRLVCSLPDSN